MDRFKIVEKRQPLHVHGYFDTRERAELHLREKIPDYCARGFFMDKTLKPCDFVIRKA